MLMEPEDKDDEQLALRHADASGGYITENQHEEKIMRDIHVGKRGLEAASEEQSDKRRKTERFEQEAPNASGIFRSICCSGIFCNRKTQSRSGSVLVRKSSHVDDDVQISALDAYYEMDGRKSRYIGEVLESVSRRRCQEM